MKKQLLIAVLCGGLLGTASASADFRATHGGAWDRGYGTAWDERDRYRPRSPWMRHHTLPRRWVGSGARLRHGASTLYWAVPPRHFWPTQRWTAGSCYRVDHLPGGRVRRVPLPNAACF